MSDSVRPQRPQPTRLPCPWDSPGKITGMVCHFLLQCMKVKVKSLSCVWLFTTHGLSKLQERVKDREAWRAAAHGVSKSWTTTPVVDLDVFRNSILHFVFVLTRWGSVWAKLSTGFWIWSPFKNSICNASVWYMGDASNMIFEWIVFSEWTHFRNYTF